MTRDNQLAADRIRLDCWKYVLQRVLAFPGMTVDRAERIATEAGTAVERGLLDAPAMWGEARR